MPPPLGRLLPAPDWALLPLPRSSDSSASSACSPPPSWAAPPHPPAPPFPPAFPLRFSASASPSSGFAPPSSGSASPSQAPARLLVPGPPRRPLLRPAQGRAVYAHRGPGSAPADRACWRAALGPRPLRLPSASGALLSGIHARPLLRARVPAAPVLGPDNVVPHSSSLVCNVSLRVFALLPLSCRAVSCPTW